MFCVALGIAVRRTAGWLVFCMKRSVSVCSGSSLDRNVPRRHLKADCANGARAKSNTAFPKGVSYILQTVVIAASKTASLVNKLTSLSTLRTTSSLDPGSNVSTAICIYCCQNSLPVGRTTYERGYGGGTIVVRMATYVMFPQCTLIRRLAYSQVMVLPLVTY